MQLRCSGLRIIQKKGNCTNNTNMIMSAICVVDDMHYISIPLYKYALVINVSSYWKLRIFKNYRLMNYNLDIWKYITIPR